MGEREEHRGGPGGARGRGEGRDRGDRGSRDGDQRKYRKFRRDNRCRFCRDKIKVIDYKDVSTLQKLTTSQGKIFSRKRSGNCAKHQRAIQGAIMRARFMALLPYISR